MAEITGIRPGQAFDPKFIENSLSRILDEYKKLGYFFSEVNWEYGDFEKDQIVIKVNIQEKELTRIGGLEFSGNSLLLKEQLLKFLEFREGDIFYESKLQKGLEKLLDIYSYKGHPLAKFSLSEFKLENNRLFFKIIIDEGPLVKIHQVKINGLKKTNEDVVLRELWVKPGNVFDQRKIDESRRKIINMGYFQNVQESFSQSYNDSVIMNFSVKESRTGQFMGVLGYNPSENDLYGDKFTGMLEAVENNIFGTGRKVALRGKLGPVDSYELSYIEPWVLNIPFDIGIHLWGARYTPDKIQQENPYSF
ncbi:hypothetical protein FJZ33_11410, partial [Candidatus Poribacteria bacterium]|nr:hypothetical protein [Candidatus Poribacteria bacterium]